MSLKLYSQVGQFKTNTILAISEIVGAKLELVHTTAKDTKEKDFKKKNPLQKFPVLETQDGCIFETNAIVRFLARVAPEKGLYGQNLHENALVDQWLDLITNEYVPSLTVLIHPVLGFYPGDAERDHQAREELKKNFAILNDHLKLNNFLVGTQVTAADIVFYGVLQLFFRIAYDEKARKSIPNVIRWFEHVSKQGVVHKYFGRVFYVKQEWQALVQNEVQEKPKDNKAAQQQQKGGQKPQQQQQQQKPKEQQKKKPKEEDEEEEEKPKFPAKNPLDLLPPSNFNLFDFKTFFVNEVDKHKAVEHFLSIYDPAGFSVWYVKYIKAEGEGKVLFLTNNLKNGFLQRLDHFRKYAFGVHGVYGEEPNLEIRGVWLWRGTGIPQEIKDLDSFEYHTWDKLDLTNAAHKKLLTEFWTGLKEEESVADGLKARDVGYFK